MLRLILILLILLTGFAAMTVNRFAGLLFYLWYALFRPESWVYIDLASLRLSILIGGLFIISSFLSGVLPFLKHPLSIGMLGFLSATLFGQFSAIKPEVGWEWIVYLGKLILVCLMLVRLANTPERVVSVIGVIAVSFGFHSAKAGLASLIAGGSQYYDGSAGAFIDNNGYALGTVMVVPFLIATAQNIALIVDRKWLRLVKWLKVGLVGAAILSVYTVVSLFSRGGLIGLIAMTSVFTLLQRKRILVFVFAMIITAMLPIVPLPQGWSERMQTISTYEETEEQSALSRFHFWRVAVDMAQAYPLFGVGLRNFEFAYDSFDNSGGRYGIGRSVHSSHFQVLAETGLVGSGFYAFLFLYSIWVALRIRSRSRIGNMRPEWQTFLYTTSNAMLASTFGFVAGGSFIALALNDLTWFTFALIASLDLVSLQLCRGDTEQVSPLPRIQSLTPVGPRDRAAFSSESPGVSLYRK